MTTTVEAIYEQGKLYLSGPLSLPDKSRVSVTIESDLDRAAWQKHSEETLLKTWDNVSDDRLNDLPKKAPMEGLVADTWEKLGRLRTLTMTGFNRGDVVLVDLGFAAKIRPCVIVSVTQPDRQRNMSVVVPMTTEIRGGECEVSFPKPAWLRQDSVVNVLGLAGVDNAKIERRLAQFPADKMLEIESVLRRLLGL